MTVTATSDKDGRLWSRRLKRADSRHKKNSRDWRPLRKLYVSNGEQRRKWGVDVQLARTLVDGIVADSYVQNPDSMIESQNGSLSGDDEMRLRNLFRTLHEDTDTKTILQRARVYGATCGFAGHWADFTARWRTEEYPATVDPRRDVLMDGVPVSDGEAPDAVRQRVVVEMLRLTGELVPPWDLRFDPFARRWDLSDCGWIARLYSCKLQDVLDDETGAYTQAGKSRLLAHVRNRSSVRGRSADATEIDETDPRHQQVEIWEVWSRADGWMIYHVPYGSEICIGSYKAHACWQESDTYPLTMIALPAAWNPADEDGDGDFYPTPDLRRVRSPLENLPRLEAAYLDSVTNSAIKWFGPAGLFAGKDADKLQTDENRVFIPIDLKAMLKQATGGETIPVEALLNFDVKRWLSELPNPAAQQASQHLEAIMHQLDLCFMLLGRGPMDRGGIPKTESATSSLGIQERLSTWREMVVEAMADIADRISEKYYLILKSHGTVPMPYRIVADGVTTFDTFDTSELKDMSLVFRHHVGSSRPPTRDQKQAERERIFGLAAPLLQSLGDTAATRDLLAWLIELADNTRASKVVDPRLQDMATQLLVLLDEFRHGLRPIDPQNSNILLEALSQFLGEYLPPARLQQVAEQTVRAAGSEASPPAAKGSGSMAKAPTAGGAAFSRGLAGAGAIGGMSSGGAAA